MCCETMDLEIKRWVKPFKGIIYGRQPCTEPSTNYFVGNELFYAYKQQIF